MSCRLWCVVTEVEARVEPIRQHRQPRWIDLAVHFKLLLVDEADDRRIGLLHVCDQFVMPHRVTTGLRLTECLPTAGRPW